MVKKSIATALLLVIAAWAEMSLALMFFMHVGHVRAVREMAEQKFGHNHVMLAGHPCCPRINNTENASLLEIAASNRPCQEEHRCCFSQGPQNVPAPAIAGQKFSRDVAFEETAEFSPGSVESHVSPMIAVAPGPPPGLLDMVIRV